MVHDTEEAFWKKGIKNGDEQKSSKTGHIARKFLAYLMAARMPAVPVETTFFLMGQWYSIRDISLNASILIILYLICFQFVHGLTNMVFDKQLDIFSGKSIMYVFKYISTKEMLFASVVLSIIGLFFLWFVNLPVFIMGLVILLVTIVYAMPPLRLKIHPPFDSIANALEFATLPFLLGWLATGNSLNSIAIIFGIILGLPAVTLYFIVSWQDINSDRKFDIQTSCVKLNHNGTIYASVIIWFVHLILAMIFFGLFSLVTLAAIICLPILLAMLFIYEKIQDYQDKLISLQYFSLVSETIWLDSVLIPLSILTFSPIPIIVLIAVIGYCHLFNAKYYLVRTRQVYTSLKKPVE